MKGARISLLVLVLGTLAAGGQGLVVRADLHWERSPGTLHVGMALCGTGLPAAPLLDLLHFVQ